MTPRKKSDLQKPKRRDPVVSTKRRVRSVREVGRPPLVAAHLPAYRTQLGEAFIGDSLLLMREMPDACVDLVVTSPPFALTRKKEYGNRTQSEYVDWFMPFAYEVFRILRTTGSFVIDIGGSWQRGAPVRSVYQYELLLRLTERFELAQDFFWYNSAKFPGPAEWVTVRRIRVTDAVNPVWWLAKSKHPKADNRRVLRPYSDSMKHLLKNGYRAKLRPSGHQVSAKFSKDHGGSIPHNLLQIANTSSNDTYLKRCKQNKVAPHPARFPEALPAFFIKFLTEPGDTVLDPFAGSNVTGRAAESLQRKWIAMELDGRYVDTSRYRFDLAQTTLLPDLV
jgi:DNA modification methylase